MDIKSISARFSIHLEMIYNLTIFYRSRLFIYLFVHHSFGKQQEKMNEFHKEEITTNNNYE